MAAFTQIQTLTASGSATSLDFTGISGTFNHLRIVAVARSAIVAATEFVMLRLNNDSGANYDFEYCRGVNSAMTVAQNTGDSGMGATGVMMLIPGSTATANYPGSLIVDIPFYAATTFFKQVLSFNYGQISTAAGGLDVVTGGGSWRNTAAVTRATLVTAGGSNLVAGSQAILYGIT